MDAIDLARVIVTVASFLAFVAIVAYAYAPAFRRRWEDAARLPLGDDRPFGDDGEGR